MRSITARASWPALVLPFALLACTGAPKAASVATRTSGPPERNASAASPTPAALSYAETFDTLARWVEAHHVFAEGRRAFWDAHKGELQREMSAAQTREEALAALRHVEHALGDRHCNLRPPTDADPHYLALGVEVHASWVSGRLVVRVSAVKDPALASRVTVGDMITAIDGAPTEAWIDQHPFETNALNPVVALQETAEAAVRVLVPWTTLRENAVRTLTLARSGKTAEEKLVFRRPHRFEVRKGKLDIDDGPDMAKITCTQADPAPYAGYDLDVVGNNLCVYRAKAAPRKPPIVRFLSFNYDLDHGSDDAALRAIRVDHDLLVRALANDARVILDIHENHGGMNPFLFVSWFARAPWGHELVRVHVSDAFSEDDVRAFLWGDDALVAKYAEAKSAKRSEMTYPFLCKAASCDRVGPRPSELVMTKPGAVTAVITGSSCTSSCDAISSMWSDFALGPIVGKQPMHGFTSVRHAIPVLGPDKRDLGRFRIALSSEGFAGKPPLEGRPIRLDWEAPEAFETRTSWLDDAVAEATRRLGG